MELVGTPERDPFGLEPAGARISLEIPTEEAPRLVRHRPWLIHRRVEIVFATRGPLFRAVNIAVGLGLAVRLRPTETTDEEVRELRRVMDLYLFSPHVRVPIEPFQTVVMHMIERPQSGFAKLSDVYREAGAAPGDACTPCPAVAVCAGYLSARTGVCPDEWRAIAEHLALVAAEIRAGSSAGTAAALPQPKQESA